jgi:hypothetical protein
MNRPCLLLILALTSLLFLCSCGVSVNLSPGTNPRAPKPVDYKIQVYQETDTIRVKYTVIGLISAGDSGFTLSCSYGTVLNKAIEKAREIGANAIQIVKVNSPNIISSCYEVKVLAIAYD